MLVDVLLSSSEVGISTMPLTLVQTSDEDMRRTRREPMATGDYVQLKDWILLEMLPLPCLE
jgi:hypothetical protein